MAEDHPEGRVSQGALWTARVMATLGLLFLTFDAAINVLRREIVAQSARELGLPTDSPLVSS